MWKRATAYIPLLGQEVYPALTALRTYPQNEAQNGSTTTKYPVRVGVWGTNFRLALSTDPPAAFTRLSTKFSFLRRSEENG